MGRKIKRRGRALNGVLLLNKSLGMSSNLALQRAKRLYHAQKAGHTGSLDPLATGLLPLCFGEATKISAYLLDSEKHYHATVVLGVRSSTGDAEGDLSLSHAARDFSAQQLESVLQGFRGVIEQIPPMHSAVQVDGQRLYHLARKGQVIDRPVRQIVISELRILNQNANRFDIAVKCSKGTYIRTLVEDIGEALGCGAYVGRLHRVGVAPYEQPTMWDLEQLFQLSRDGGDEALDACLLPIESALAHWDKVELSELEQIEISHGRVVARPAPAERFLLYAKGQFLGLGKLGKAGEIAPMRLFPQLFETA